MSLEQKSFIDPRSVKYSILAIYLSLKETNVMASTNSCLPEAVPLLTFHFRTRQATRADVPSIAKMIKVIFTVTICFLEKKKPKKIRIEAQCLSALGLVIILRLSRKFVFTSVV